MRRKNDAYYSPQWLVESIFDRRLEYGIHGSILEPCCGDGAISNYFKFLEGKGGQHPITRVYTNDVDESVTADRHIKAQNLILELGHEYDWIITNPPFSQAHEIVPIAYEKAKEGIVMLLRLSWLEPCKNRQDFLKKHPPSIIIVSKRISFTNNGKADSCTVAWFIWHKFLKCNNQIQFLF